MATIISPHAGLCDAGVDFPAVALRYTAGYAIHTPSGVNKETKKRWIIRIL
ncbi:MAG: hypothetical protein LBE12_15785 [Planctomycetaceae bacterium]|nr:hypothetical protein [Planctomycetaceae bacterium]